MSTVTQTGVQGVSLPCAAEAIYKGKLYKDNGSGQMTVCTAKGDTVVAIALESTVDAQTGDAKTLAAGDQADFALLGSGMIVQVYSEASTTYQTFGAVYCADTTDGACNITAATSRPIGFYMGKDATATSSSAGDLIPVYLGTAIGAANV